MISSSLQISAKQADALRAGLDAYESCYDPTERMLLLPVPANASYHTRLRGGDVHQVYKSLVYAVALLDADDENLRLRAIDVLDRVIDLQDQDAQSPTYGIWSWYLEEPLSQMAPPDWNFADFCGAQLLEAVLIHEERLPAALVVRIDEAILHAARSIERRNVAPDYTNISIMGSFVALAAAERGNIEDLHAYARARFTRFYEHTCAQGGFNEYNSPTYTYIALTEIVRIRRYIRDEVVQRYAQELYRRGWELIASVFHAPSGQWSGPHSRCYTTFLNEQVSHFIQESTHGQFKAVKPLARILLDEQRFAHECPKDLIPAFLHLDRARMVRQLFQRQAVDVIGATYLHPSFTLSTINRGDLWNQRRALLAYWGTPKNPRYLHLRFLHDGYDFSAAQFFSVQNEGTALAGITFAHDAGDTHISLDMIKDGTIQAKDLRVRLELGGLPESVDLLVVPGEGGEFSIRDGDVQIHGALPCAKWDGSDGRFEIGGDGTVRWIDCVLYAGASRSFRMQTMGASLVAMALRITAQSGAPIRDVFAGRNEGWLSWRFDGLSLRLPEFTHAKAESVAWEI